VLDGLTISNGIGWSPDGTTMYLADSGTRDVDAFDFDPAARICWWRPRSSGPGSVPSSAASTRQPSTDAVP
jgi:sugar lactone lactonase YvrE